LTHTVQSTYEEGSIPFITHSDQLEFRKMTKLQNQLTRTTILTDCDLFKTYILLSHSHTALSDTYNTEEHYVQS